tara:strand:+ start:397 stop:603 length:207 start_codon:yes stop_codon:yes gene_type:complete
MITSCIYLRNRLRYEEVTYLEVLLCKKTQNTKKKLSKDKNNFEILNDYHDIVAAIFHEKEYSDTSSMD